MYPARLDPRRPHLVTPAGPLDHLRTATLCALIRAALALAVMVGAAGCGPAASTPPATLPTASPPSPPQTPPATPATSPSPATSTAGPTAPTSGPTLPTTTTTEWGPIWDDVPARFPRMLASEPTETGAGPASAVLIVAARTADAAAWYGSALPAAGYPVEATSGPYEDGGYVIDATGPARGCRVQVALAKMGTATIATILFGAACPFR